MFCRLFPIGSSRVLDRPWGLRKHAAAFVVACAACLTPFAASAGNFTAAPMNLDFGSVPLGATATLVVTVTNTSIVVRTVEFAGGNPLDTTNFHGAQACGGAILGLGGSCKVFYYFHPTTLGAKSENAGFEINSERFFPIPLSGKGVGGVAVAPTAISFGSVLVGATSDSVVVTVTNITGAPLGPLVVAGGGVSPPFAMTQKCQGVTLAIGGSCTFVYGFSPIAAGPAVTTSSFTINGMSVTVSLLGAGNSPQIESLAVIEFYNASLDHYFITHAADEIAKLDAGVVIKGWTRTGKSFKAFAPAQGGTTDICRIYIIPLHGDSHFFGRGQQECDDTMAAHPDFFMEESRFMAMILPVAGVCPAGTVPVYRVFSNRPDANHRYTIERAVRASMEALGWLAEGDGPDLVAMCAPS